MNRLLGWIRRWRQTDPQPAAPAKDDPSAGVASEQMEQARKLKAAGEYRDAIATYSSILTEFPTHAPALYQRGYCYTCVNDYHRADDDFRRGFELDPGYANSLGTVVRRTMLAARSQVDPEKEPRRETMEELVERKFPAEVWPDVVRVLRSIEEHPPYAVSVDQLQRAAIELCDDDGCFITERLFLKSDPRDLIMIAASHQTRSINRISQR